MDMSIQLKVPSGPICTLALSFNNKGPIGYVFRYICDNGTYIARYDDLVDGDQQPVDLSNVAVSMNGIELQDREFFAAIKEGREPNASVRSAFPRCRRWIVWKRASKQIRRVVFCLMDRFAGLSTFGRAASRATG